MLFRPDTSIRLPVPHIQQQAHGECLAACTAMCLAYLQRPVKLPQLSKLLRIQAGVGTQFSNIQNLKQLNVAVSYRQYGTLDELYRFLTRGYPCITSVQTQELPYWNQINVYHVVVVVGMDQKHIYLNDPELPAGPIPVSIGDFDLAWLAQDETYAVIGL